jgi:hypothetical protein
VSELQSDSSPLEINFKKVFGLQNYNLKHSTMSEFYYQKPTHRRHWKVLTPSNKQGSFEHVSPDKSTYGLSAFP